MSRVIVFIASSIRGVLLGRGGFFGLRGRAWLLPAVFLQALPERTSAHVERPAAGDPVIKTFMVPSERCAWPRTC